MQVEPLRIPPGPLAGRRVIKLRSSLHHSYAVTDTGEVFRFGWRGIVLPLQQTKGLRVSDIAHGYCGSLVLVDE